MLAAACVPVGAEESRRAFVQLGSTFILVLFPIERFSQVGQDLDSPAFYVSSGKAAVMDYSRMVIVITTVLDCFT